MEKMVFTKTHKLFATGVSIVFIFLIGFLIGHFYNRNVKASIANLLDMTEESDPSLLQFLKTEINAKHIKNHLK